MPDTVCLVDLIYLVVDLICLVVLTGCYLPGGRPDMHGSPDRHGGRPDMPGRPNRHVVVGLICLVDLIGLVVGLIYLVDLIDLVVGLICMHGSTDRLI